MAGVFREDCGAGSRSSRFAVDEIVGAGRKNGPHSTVGGNSAGRPQRSRSLPQGEVLHDEMTTRLQGCRQASQVRSIECEHRRAAGAFHTTINSFRCGRISATGRSVPGRTVPDG